MFQFLPDVHLPKKYKIMGSLLVAFMLLVGKHTISLYIENSRLNELGGASASIILLMLWIYYTSLILFLGAEVIKSMAKVEDCDFQPRRYATRVDYIKAGNKQGETIKG